MRTIRFSSRILLLITAIVAAYLAALAKPSEMVENLASSALYLMLPSSVLLVIYSRGATKAFWLGFAVFGWGGHFLNMPFLLHPLLKLLHPLYFGTMPNPQAVDDSANAAFGDQWTDFMNVGEALGRLAVPFLGGLLALYLSSESNSILKQKSDEVFNSLRDDHIGS